MNAADAKRENDKRLEALRVVVNPHLPAIEEPAELKPRSAQDVAARVWVLSHIIGVGYGSIQCVCFTVRPSTSMEVTGCPQTRADHAMSDRIAN